MYWTNAAIDVLLFFFVIVCGLMCLVVLMQRSKQEGLGAAFGGGFTESVWGAQTSQVLVKATVWLAALFFIISICLARLYTVRAGFEKQVSPIQQQLEHPVATSKAAIPNTAAPGNPAGIPAGEAVVPTAAPVKPNQGLTMPTNAAPIPPPK
jgi:preprotein translocase subunit SecG